MGGLIECEAFSQSRKIVLASVKSKLYLDGLFVWLVGRGGLGRIGLIGACLAQGCPIFGGCARRSSEAAMNLFPAIVLEDSR